MNSSFYTAITGAKGHQYAVDTTANNIANINTTGYKASEVGFGTLYSEYLATNHQTTSSSQGLGVRVSATAIDTRGGTYQQTDSPFDVAISGDGWFGVIGSNSLDAKEVAYTRNGTFAPDQDRYLVNQNGNYVLGSSYGNLMYKDGKWQIDTEKKAGGLSTVGAQSPIFVPDDLYYPPTATQNAVIKANLQTDSTQSTKKASASSDLSALYDKDGKSLNINPNQSLLISAGDENFFAESGTVYIKKNIPEALTSPVAISVNGTTITASWSDGSTQEEIAQMIASLLSNAGVDASSQGRELLISSENSLAISSSSGFLFADSSAKIVRFDSVQTLADLASEMQSIADKTDHGATVSIRYDGSIAISSSKDMAIGIKATENSSEALIKALQPLTNGANKELKSESFLQNSKKTAQNIITENGDRHLLTNELVEIAPVGKSKSSWQSITKITTEEMATSSSKLDSLMQNGKSVEIQSGEELLISFGKSPTKAGGNYGYEMKIVPNSSATNISFTLNGEDFSFSLPSGQSADQIRVAVANQLANSGYETKQNGDNLVIYPKNGELVFQNGSTNLSGVNYQDMSMVLYQHGGGSLGDFVSLADSYARQVGATISLNGGKISVQNQNSTNLIISSFLATENTSDEFRKLFASISSTVSPNGSLSTNSLVSQRVLSESVGVVSFDENGRAVGDTAVTLDNSGKELNFKLDLTAFDSGGNFSSITADGSLEGRFDSYTIDKDGQIIANFTNAKSAVVAQLAVYHFVNDQGLMRIGDSLFMQSDNSSEPFFYLDKEGNPISGAMISSYTLEGSNVDAAEALTQLIIYQRGYEGNAKAITTSDQLIQNAINMKK